MTRFLVFDIGCIECGESSAVVGIYATQPEAQAALVSRAGNEDGGYFSSGQHEVGIFELPEDAS